MLCTGLQLPAKRAENVYSGSLLEITPLGTWPSCASLDRPEERTHKKYSTVLNFQAALFSQIGNIGCFVDQGFTVDYAIHQKHFSGLICAVVG